VRDGPKHRGRGRWARILTLVCLIVLVLAALAWGQAGYEVEGVDRLNRGGPDPVQQIEQFWQQYGKFFIWGGACLLLVAALWILKPFRFFDAAGDWLLRRSLRGVEDLLKRIQEEAETTTEDAKSNNEEAAVVEEGLLAGLAEVAEFSNAEQVPSYVLTVNDLMLDNIRVTLKRLRRFTEGNAQRYRDYMFSVLKGIKTLTEQSAEGGVSSGLAVDVREYFADDKRYQAWRKLLSPAARRGRHQEVAEGFLRFMRDVREGRPVQAAKPVMASVGAVAASVPDEIPEIPTAVNEETLPALQRAAAQEASDFCSLVRTGRASDDGRPWQFEFVRRQQRVHLRAEAQRMLAVFLSSERKALQQLTRIRMLPCRTWEHVLHLLGVADTAQLQQRVEAGLLTTQEILILAKVFLQTFAKREALGHIYGRDKDAGLMMDLHVPQMRREALKILRQLHQVQSEPLDDATGTLDEEETPQNNQVRRLIEHYVHQRHDPPRGERKHPRGPETAR
jgi:hypothetical protein